MKVTLATLTLALLVFCLILAARHFGRAEPRAALVTPAEFSITIIQTAHGDSLQCQKGCNWRALYFGCEVKEHLCQMQLDQVGMHASMKHE
jgi:hypothetical protein